MGDTHIMGIRKNHSNLNSVFADSFHPSYVLNIERKFRAFYFYLLFTNDVKMFIMGS